MKLPVARLLNYSEEQVRTRGVPEHYIRFLRIYRLLKEHGAEPAHVDLLVFDYADKYESESEAVVTRALMLNDLRHLGTEGLVLRDVSRQGFYVVASDEAQARLDELLNQANEKKAARAERAKQRAAAAEQEEAERATEQHDNDTPTASS